MLTNAPLPVCFVYRQGILQQPFFCFSRISRYIFLLQITFNDPGSFLNGHIAGVQAEVIIGGGVPGLAGIIVVIFSPLPVSIFDAVNGGVPLQREGCIIRRTLLSGSPHTNTLTTLS